jgi:hypothetical protein
MIYIVCGDNKKFYAVCDKLGITGIKQARAIIAGDRFSCRGLRFRKGDRLIITCGFFNDAEWWWGEFTSSLMASKYSNVEPEFIGCCDRLDCKTK